MRLHGAFGSARRNRALHRGVDQLLRDVADGRQPETTTPRRVRTLRPPRSVRPRAVRQPRAVSAVRPSPVFLGVLAVAALGAEMAWHADVSDTKTAAVGVFTFVLASWVTSLCLHEFGHAYVGYRAGDHGPADAGYLTLNPLRYGHPVLTLVFPLLILLSGGIGLPGGAVLLHHHRFRSKGWASAVSAAGPAVNLLLAVTITAFIRLADPAGHAAFWAGLAFAGYLQLSVGLINLLPIPGIDGWGIWEPWMPTSWQEAGTKVKPFGFFILFGLFAVGTAGVHWSDFVSTVATHAGLPPLMWMSGAWLFQFWKV